MPAWVLAPTRHFFMCGKPNIAKTFHVLYQPIQQRDAAAVANDMRVHGQQEQATFTIGAFEFGGEHLLHA